MEISWIVQLEFRDVLRRSEEAEAEVAYLRDQARHVRKSAVVCHALTAGSVD